jgi:hypothetical protein
VNTRLFKLYSMLVELEEYKKNNQRFCNESSKAIFVALYSHIQDEADIIDQNISKLKGYEKQIWSGVKQGLMKINDEVSNWGINNEN